MKNKALVLGSIVVLIVGFIAAQNFYAKSEQKSLDNIAVSSSGAPFIREHSPSYGENKNKVQIVEFIDPLCEACAAFHPTTKRLSDEYYEEALFVVRYLANHSNSRYAVKILEASREQGKFKEVLDVIFSTQSIWAAHGQSKPQMIWDFLSQVKGLDIQKLRETFDSIDISNILSLDIEDARTLKVRGTPTFFVNKKRLTDFSPEGLYDLVESEIYK